MPKDFGTAPAEPPRHGLHAQVRRYWPSPLLGLIGLLTAAPWLGAYSVKLDFLGQFLIQTAAMTTAVVLLFLVWRRWLAVACGLLGLLLQLAVLQPSLFPARASAEAPAAVEVLFTNVWWRNRELPAMAEAIIARGPDVVVLSELYADGRSILSDLATAYPYRADCLAHWSCDSAILSRLPIQADLSNWQGKRRIAMSAARIATTFGSVTVAGVHLDQPLPPGRLRVQERQVDGLVEMLAPLDGPLLLVGDFNAAPWGRLLRGLAARTSLVAARGIEGTWPAALPWPLRIAIDHALTGRGLQLLDRQVIRLPGSDHRALHLRVAPAAAVALAAR